MATKNISITDEAYNRLTRLRKRNESFSEIIIDITGNVKLMDFFGAISKNSGDKLEKKIHALRNKETNFQDKKLREIFKI